MRKFLIITTFLALGTIANAQEKLYADEFPLGDVTLLDGPLKKAQDLNPRRQPIRIGTDLTDT